MFKKLFYKFKFYVLNNYKGPLGNPAIILQYFTVENPIIKDENLITPIADCSQFNNISDEKLLKMKDKAVSKEAWEYYWNKRK